MLPSVAAIDRLIDRLFSVGQRLSPALEKQILEHGIAAEPLLLEIIDDDALFAADARGLGYAPIHALRLLGVLRATAAIPTMLDVLRSSDSLDLARGAAAHALGAIGPPALEPCLAALAAAAAVEDRIDLPSILSELGVRDERIYEALLAELARDPESGAGSLVAYGDSRAVSHLASALDEHQLVRSDSLFANQAVIELSAAIEDLGGQLTDSQRAKHDRVVASRRRLSEPLHDMKSSDDTEPKPGRNEPCHCGSGKKYKKCHLAADENAALP